MMIHKMSIVSVVLGLLVFGFLATPVFAQDATEVDSAHYKLEFENEHVRVLRISYGPGEKSVMHDHASGVAVFLTDHHVKFTFPDGETREVAAKAGQTVWAPGGQHLPENISDKAWELILVEVKGETDSD